MKFLKNNKRFSFMIGNTCAWDLPFDVKQKAEEHTVTTVFMFANGLRVTNIAEKHEKFGAYSWVNYFENTSDTPTAVLSEIWDCDCTLSIEHEDDRKWVANFPDRDTATKVFSPTGSTWTEKEFYCNVDEMRDNQRIHHIQPGETKKYSAVAGRSSGEAAPFFYVHKNGKGYYFAIGWSGQWNCEICRGNDSLTFRSKVQDTCFKLYPGEKIRTL